MPRGKIISELPYGTRIYINGQVLIPASLVRALGIEWARYASIVMRYGGKTIELRKVQLLRPRRAASRQFTIPKEVREKYGIKPFDEIEILSIKPARMKEMEYQAIGH